VDKALQFVLEQGPLAALVPFVATLMLVAAIRPFAPALGLLAFPGGRRLHTAPTPLIGGPAIVFGALAAGILLLPPTRDLEALGAASLLLLGIGLLDDRFDIDWRVRVASQVTAALILYFWGDVRIESIGAALGFTTHSLGVFSLPFTVLATVGVTNAMNMADGVDGLASSLCLAALAMLTAAAIYSGNGPLALDLVLMAGAVLGFLCFNLRTPWLPRATAFLGGGAEILGLWVAWASFRLTQMPGHPVTPVLAPFLIALPVIDCLVLIAHRLRAGRSPFSSDRNHLHHRLQEAGLSATSIVAGLTAASLAIGLVAGLALRANVPEVAFPAVYLAATAIHFMATRRSTSEKPAAKLGTVDRVEARTGAVDRAGVRPEAAKLAKAVKVG
jgi:UDP-GlcNAc:undecaprenyl-phosphate/decaprenyl-phosphate GlcNAc-1-phosphate transferase